jgi:hypothetical protein
MGLDKIYLVLLLVGETCSVNEQGAVHLQLMVASAAPHPTLQPAAEFNKCVQIL